ncbi:hypothetical protein RND81_05G149700 [Saponaria officinalis]|uniref:CCHC-type domain-containing protein n=1 Tax=Saponaria officinalis TaxID=3572 RepID=A0AAW1KZA8_SAPOF
MTNYKEKKESKTTLSVRISCPPAISLEISSPPSSSMPYEKSEEIEDWFMVNAMVVSWIDNNEPLSSFNRAYSTLDQEEGARNVGASISRGMQGDERSDPIVFPSHASQYGSLVPRLEGAVEKDGDNRPKCDNCNRFGHVRSKCFDLIGYPKSWKDRGREPGGSTGRGRGYGQPSTGGRGYGSGHGRGGANATQVAEEVSETKDQSRVSKATIGAGEQRGRLCILKGVTSGRVSAVKKSIDDGDIWHRKLGHPSRRVVQLLPFTSDNKQVAWLCEISPRVKQTKDKFIISENKATKIFELIHCDLWGDYRTLSTCGSRYFLTIVDGVILVLVGFI